MDRLNARSNQRIAGALAIALVGGATGASVLLWAAGRVAITPGLAVALVGWLLTLTGWFLTARLSIAAQEQMFPRRYRRCQA
jgi:hypothetical protein